MTGEAARAASSLDDTAIVTAQIGRAPRDPWRVGARCRYGYPVAIVSPARLSDTTLFPTFAWLTCPWIATAMSAAESSGATAAWAKRAAQDESVSAGLRAADMELRRARARESGGEDPCPAVGLAGQRDPLGVKCLHAHAALVLVGIHDPVGEAELGKIDRDCPDGRCAALVPPVSQERAL